MQCIYCQKGDAVVTESVTNGRVILRYRRCKVCKKRFFSEESTNITDENLRQNFFKIRRGEMDVAMAELLVATESRCVWKPHGQYGWIIVPPHENGSARNRDDLKNRPCCAVCGKRIKISEVE